MVKDGCSLIGVIDRGHTQRNKLTLLHWLAFVCEGKGGGGFDTHVGNHAW